MRALRIACSSAFASATIAVNGLASILLAVSIWLMPADQRERMRREEGI